MLLLRRLLLVATVLAILVGGWSFAGHNGETVTVDLVYLTLPGMPLWQLLLGSIGLGWLTGWLLIAYRLARAGLAARRYRRTIGRLEAEVAQLRNLPLEPGVDPTPLADAGPGATSAGPGS